jgi:FMN phosphatase YigB (HAD superfamily)
VSSVPNIKTIFWDIGGVLLTNGWDRGQQATVLNPLGVDLDDYRIRHDAANFFWERGLINAVEFFKRTIFHADQPSRNFTFEELWPQVCAQSRVLHAGSFDILSSISSSGQYKVATLNNESRELNSFRLDSFNLKQYFHYFICSGYVHEMKPHPDIYRAAVDISGYPAQTAIFIDDKTENCDAARSVGMHAIHFESPQQLQRDLAQLGVQAATT